MPKDLFGSGALYKGLRGGIGTVIEESVPVTLGWIDENGNRQLKVPDDKTDGVQKYYFTRAAEEPPGEAHNLGLNPLLPQFIKFGAPIYVSRAGTGKREWYINGLQPGEAAEFFGGRTQADPTPVYLEQFVPGLIGITSPASMRVQVFGAPYTLNGEFKWIGTRISSDMTAEIPATDGQAKYALVQIDFATATVDLQYGTEFDAALTHQQAWTTDGGSGTLFPQPDRDKFRAGYVKLISGMTAVQRAHIWAVQEIYTKSDYADILVACDEVVTYDGEVVTV